MSQEKDIARAIGLLRPACSSVRTRRPKGMTPRTADLVADLLQKSVDNAQAALSVYENAGKLASVLSGHDAGARA